MRRLFEHAAAGLAGFLEQRDDVALLVGCSDDDSALVLKLLSDLDRSTPVDVVLLFPDAFADAGSFVTGVAARVEEQVRAANIALRAETRPLLPGLPAAARDVSGSPAERLRGVLGAARDVLPQGHGHRLMCGLIPTAVADWPAYRALIADCLPRRGVEPWMRNLRLVWRDQPGRTDSLGQRSRRLDVDFGPKAVERSLAEDAIDPAVPEAHRAQSVLMLALTDAAHGRGDAASARFDTLEEYATRVEDPVTRALVLNGRGDVALRAKKPDEARGWYEKALDPAAESKQPVVLATVVENLARLAFARNDYPEAASYYDTLAGLALLINEPATRARALSDRGLSEEQLRDFDRALASFAEAALVGEAFGLDGVPPPNWENYRRAAKAAGRTDLAAEAAEHLNNRAKKPR